jgi:hypothetical protein
MQKRLLWVTTLSMLALGCQVSSPTGGGDAGPGTGGAAQGGGAGSSGSSGAAGSYGLGGEAGSYGFGGEAGAYGFGGEAGAYGVGGEGGGGGSCDTSAFTDIHWSTPSCPGSVCWDTLIRSDGTYQKQRIVTGDGNPILFCEHGTWQALECGMIQFQSCLGDTYNQSWSFSPGAFELQNVSYSEDSFGIFNCGPTEC